MEFSGNPTITYPTWYQNEEGKCCTIISSSNKIYLKIKCINDGFLKINLRGPDKRGLNKSKQPVYVCYHKMLINNESLFSKDYLVWHDKPYIYTRDCEDGEIIDIKIECSTLNNYYPFINELIKNLDKNRDKLDDDFETLSEYLDNLIIINDPLN